MRKLLKIKNPPSIVSSAAVVGRKEAEGPLGADFDLYDSEDRFGMETWEQAESEMQRRALTLALQKAGMDAGTLDAVFAGDLMNQCAASSFGLLDFHLPYFGLYGACSTMAEALMLAALLVGNGVLSSAAAVTSSHFCSAERQFRTPVEYGGQRTPTAQWTVTGAGAAILAAEGEGPYLCEVLPGVSVERGITDANNMGAAMAPAAADTLRTYFTLSGRAPDSFDAILTGDLGALGHRITSELLSSHGFPVKKVYNDCGLLIYSAKEQDVHSGGSGCGCSASVFCGPVMKRFRKGIYRDILFVGTGALMSPGSVGQGLPIPGIAHLVRICAEKPDTKGEE